MPEEIPTNEEENESKWCSQCGERKLVSEFHFDTTSPDGRKGSCKQCRVIVKQFNDRRLSDVEESGLEAIGNAISGGSFNPFSEEIVDAVMRILGGHYGFAKVMIAHFYQCRPGSAQRTKVLAMILDLVKQTDQGEGLLDKMADDEIAHVIRAVMAKRIVNAK